MFSPTFSSEETVTDPLQPDHSYTKRPIPSSLEDISQTPCSTSVDPLDMTNLADDEEMDTIPIKSEEIDIEDDDEPLHESDEEDIRLTGYNVQEILDLSSNPLYKDTYILTKNKSVVSLPRFLLLCGSNFLKTIFQECEEKQYYIMLPDFDKAAVEDCIEYMRFGTVTSPSEERFEELRDLLKLFQIPFSAPTEIQKEVVCEECGNVFRDKFLLRKHTNAKHSADPLKPRVEKKKNEFICDYCGRVLKDKYSLKSHISVIHVNTDKNVECPVCFKKFKTKWALKSHSVAHEGKKFICETCGLQTKTKMALTLHLETHAEVRRYKCDFCPKSFSVKTYRTYHHQAAHSHTRPHKCGDCGKSFKVERQLRNHTRIVHDSVKSIKCLLCSYSCSNMTNMTLHLIIHSGTKPYHCSVCSETFKHKEEGRRHARAKHPIDLANVTFVMNEEIKKLSETAVKVTPITEDGDE